MASVLRPKRPVWFAGSLIAAAVALVLYAVWASVTPWRPGRTGGLVFGILAALLFAYDGLYPVRRRLLAWPLRTAQRWLQLHIYGGVLALLFVFLHVGFALPRGTMGWWLLGLAIWTTGTGALGTLLQKWIPVVIAGSLRVEALAVRIPEITARLLSEADRVMRGASDPRLLASYQADIRPALERPEPAWAYVTNVESGLRRYDSRLSVLERVGDKDRAGNLRALIAEKAELDVHLSLQRALRVWLILHVPAAMALLALLAVHIFAVLYL